MRTDISHLPIRNQRELERIVKAIFEEFEDEHKLAQGDRKLGRILKILLYGSFARGDWVYDPASKSDYRSDYDLMIIVNQDDLTNEEHWVNLEDRLARDFTILHRLRHPAKPIVHTLQEVNNNLAQGRYFFTDIVRDAIGLYQSDDSELASSKTKTPAEALALAKEYFEDWYPSAGEYYDTFRYDVSLGRTKKAAFELHQSAERLYHTLLLTCTLYTPHSHNLENLRSIARRIDPRLVYVWPNATKADRARFNRLKDAYVKARYSKHYRISPEDLAWLGERVRDLSDIVRAVCLERIAELTRLAAPTL